MAEKERTTRTFGGFLIKEKLGVGGMATVYRAYHQKRGLEVALKVIHEHFADDEIAVKRLEREAKIVQQLKHPGIVRILAFGKARGRPYLVMPYLPNGTLADYFANPREIKVKDAFALLNTLAQALDYAHAKGVVHRDFKLENILLDEHNQPAISDFGIAKTAATTRITATGHFLGTPHYMAPEQVKSGVDAFDYRVDLYAFAVMCYLLCTGYYPFTADDPLQLVMKHTQEMPPIPSTVNKKLPHSLDAVLLRGLSKNPEERYQTAHEFIDDLEAALASHTPGATTIFLAKLNPGEGYDVRAEMILPKNEPDGANLTPDFQNATKVLDMEGEEALAPEAESDSEETTRRRLPIAMLLTLFILLGLGAFVLANNDGFLAGFALGDADSTEASTEITEDALVVENTDDVATEALETAAETDLATATDTATASPTRTPTATRTPRNTASPTRTPTSTLSPTRRATNTPVPPTPVPPTPVPPTPAPPTPVPPTPVPPTDEPSILDPIATIADPILDPITGGGDDDDDDGGCLLGIGC